MKNYLIIAFKFRQRARFTKIIAVHMRDGNFQNLARLSGASKRRIRTFHPNVYLAAEKAQPLVAHHGPG